MNGRWIYFKTQYPLVKRLLADTKRGREVQQRVLLNKIRRSADSDFGRQHGFSQIRSSADFRRSVPITDFEYVRPYVERVQAGESTALFGPQTKLLMFALTSGTTEKPKHVPVTEHFVRDYKRGWKLWGLQTHADHMDLLRKNYLHLASDWQQQTTGSGIWCGNISGLAAETRPAVVRRPFIIPPEAAKIKDWVNRQYAVLRLSMMSDRVGMIITANPLTLVKLAELADQQKEALIRDIHDGTVTFPAQQLTTLAPKLQRKLLKADKQRSRELQRLAERRGQLLPMDFWPQLSVIAVWMGGPLGTFLPEVRRLYGDRAFRDHGLSASEGRMTLPMQDEANAGLLDFTSNYFEFIPVEAYSSEGLGETGTDVLEAHELEIGKQYYILLTNSAGMFRYNIQDVVECVGYEGQVPLLKFLHKGAHCTNVAGEKITEYQVAAAIHDSFVSLNRNVETVMLVPELGNPPRYVLLMEQHAIGIGTQLAKELDSNLSRLNCEYEDRLKTGRLLPIRIQEVPTGTWEQYRERRITLRGGSQEQYKHTFLGNSPEIYNQLMQSLTTNNRS